MCTDGEKMIQNDTQLGIVREQLARAEAALESLRHEVQPKNEQMYRVMAESYVDTILSLRADVDAYLGIVVTQTAEQDTECGELEGVIRSVDLDAQTFVLRDRPDAEPDLLCEYGPDLEDAVKECLDSRVIVAGSIETSRKTHKSKMSADRISYSTNAAPST